MRAVAIEPREKNFAKVKYLVLEFENED